MRKKNEVMLYDGGLTLLLVLVVILTIVLAQNAKRVKDECRERLTKERISTPYYSDNELITKYYQIEAELQNALGSAKKTIILPIGKGFIASSGKGTLIKKKINTLRQIRALYLAEIYKRGLKLPK